MHGLHQVIDLAGRDAADPGLLDHRHQGLLRGPTRLEKAGEIRSLPQLGHPQVQSAQPGLQLAIAIAVPVCLAPVTTLKAAGADHAFDVMLHQRLEHRLRHGAQEIALIVLLQKLDQRHVGLGHPLAGRAMRSMVPRGGVSIGSWLKCANSTITDVLDGHPGYIASAAQKSTT